MILKDTYFLGSTLVGTSINYRVPQRGSVAQSFIHIFIHHHTSSRCYLNRLIDR